jgi:glycosyltransferase involved in cell wall biosynthesis
MRVCFDSRYIRERPSGIGEYVQALVDRLPALAPADRFDWWVHPRAKRPLSRAPNSFEHVVPGDPNAPWSQFFPSLMGPTDGDVFHSPHNILGRGIRAAAVVTLHDVMWLDAPELAEGSALLRSVTVPFNRWGILNTLRQARRILTVSQASADAIARICPGATDRIRVAHNAAAARFRPPADMDVSRARAAAILGTTAPYFILVGQNAPSKGHALALHAFARLPGLSLRLVLVQRLRAGHGIDRLARSLGVRERVHVLPTLNNDDLVTLLQSALALLQPSLAEGFGMPALEALCSGCPVIASDIPPLVELLGGAGLHARRGEIDSLAVAMRRVAASAALRQELSHGGLERARAFSWDSCAKATLETYREAAKLGPL